MVHILTEVRSKRVAPEQPAIYILIYLIKLFVGCSCAGPCCVNFKVNCDFLLYVSATSYFVVNKGGSIFLLINNFQ